MISREELTKLYKIKGHIVARDLLTTWFLIFVLLQSTIYTKNLFFLAVIFILVGCLQNGLITWVHEASHKNLCEKKSKNDLIADLVVCGPVGVSVNGYRWHHVNHHKYLGDPQKEIELTHWLCLKGTNLFLEIIKHGAGYYGLQLILRKQRFSKPNSRFSPPPKWSRCSKISFFSFNSILFFIFYIQGSWQNYFIFWVAPLFTVALLISNFRTIVEHQENSTVCENKNYKMEGFTRLIKTNWLGRFLIAPTGFYYHYEHHLYPGVPYHRLPELRKLLEEKNYYSQNNISFENGYLLTICKLAFKNGYGVKILNPFFTP